MDVLTDKTRVKGGEIMSSTEGFSLLLSPLSFVFFIIIIDKIESYGENTIMVVYGIVIEVKIDTYYCGLGEGVSGCSQP
jgi:hypothetical protein